MINQFFIAKSQFHFATRGQFAVVGSFDRPFGVSVLFCFRGLKVVRARCRMCILILIIHKKRFCSSHSFCVFCLVLIVNYAQ